MDIDTVERQFWCVWNPRHNVPRVKHWSHEAAVAEAERLSSANRGQAFYVLEQVGRATVETGEQ